MMRRSPSWISEAFPTNCSGIPHQRSLFRLLSRALDHAATRLLVSIVQLAEGNQQPHARLPYGSARDFYRRASTALFAAVADLAAGRDWVKSSAAAAGRATARSPGGGMIVDFQHHYTPPELLKVSSSSVSARLDEDGNPSYLQNPLLIDLPAH